MKALLSRQAGGPESLTLEDVPEPVPGPGEVRVVVRACGVNFPDLGMYLDGDIKPAVTERFPLARGGEALASLESRGARGKVVVIVE